MNPDAPFVVEYFEEAKSQMKLVKRFTYKDELVTIQKDGFMQYYFEFADGIQRSKPKLTARGAAGKAGH
jgi:hypothetical protein